MLDLEGLKNEVARRYGSIHAFAKTRPAGLARSTIYQVFAGRYAGRVERATARITAALDEADDRDWIFETLRKVACARCRRNPRRKKRCEKCFELFRAQAKELNIGGGYVEEKQN